MHLSRLTGRKDRKSPQERRSCRCMDKKNQKSDLEFDYSTIPKFIQEHGKLCLWKLEMKSGKRAISKCGLFPSNGTQVHKYYLVDCRNHSMLCGKDCCISTRKDSGNKNQETDNLHPLEFHWCS